MTTSTSVKRPATVQHSLQVSHIHAHGGECVHMSPKESMNFRSEDFVGLLARLGHSCSMGVRGTKLSSKIIPKYGPTPFSINKPGFNTKSSLDD